MTKKSRQKFKHLENKNTLTFIEVNKTICFGKSLPTLRNETKILGMFFIRCDSGRILNYEQTFSSTIKESP